MRKILLFCLLLVAFLVTGCAGEEVAVSIPADMERTRLADTLENPSVYDGKKVLLEGVVGRGCLSCPTDFPYQEGVNTIQLFVKGFRRPSLRTGQPVRVYSEVKAGEERVVISALAMEVRR